MKKFDLDKRIEDYSKLMCYLEKDRKFAAICSNGSHNNPRIYETESETQLFATIAIYDEDNCRCYFSHDDKEFSGWYYVNWTAEFNGQFYLFLHKFQKSEPKKICPHKWKFNINMRCEYDRGRVVEELFNSALNLGPYYYHPVVPGRGEFHDVVSIGSIEDSAWDEHFTFGFTYTFLFCHETGDLSKYRDYIENILCNMVNDYEIKEIPANLEKDDTDSEDLERSETDLNKLLFTVAGSWSQDWFHSPEIYTNIHDHGWVSEIEIVPFDSVIGLNIYVGLNKDERTETNWLMVCVESYGNNVVYRNGYGVPEFREEYIRYSWKSAKRDLEDCFRFNHNKK